MISMMKVIECLNTRPQVSFERHRTSPEAAMKRRANILKFIKSNGVTLFKNISDHVKEPETNTRHDLVALFENGDITKSRKNRLVNYRAVS